MHSLNPMLKAFKSHYGKQAWPGLASPALHIREQMMILAEDWFFHGSFIEGPYGVLQVEQ
jgi:hypothetical protein